jgi:alpha,alpha-trehalose phosphorylase
VIKHGAFTTEPWAIHETALSLEILAQTESLFSLSNGHVGLRGNLDEGEPHGLPGTYLNGFYEVRPLPYAEPGYGFPESAQSVVNVTNGKLIRLLVEDEPFDVRYGTLHSHDRRLDFRSGVLERSVEWTTPSSQTVQVRSTRLVSLTQRAIAAIRYTVTPIDRAARVVIQSELLANEELPPPTEDPRANAALSSPLESVSNNGTEMRAILEHKAHLSELRISVVMDHVVEGQDIPIATTTTTYPDAARVTLTAELKPGQALTLVKFVSYGWSLSRSFPALEDQSVAAGYAARQTGWEGLLAEQRSYLDDFWARADVEVGGDEEVQQAVRFALFQALQAGARAEGRAIPAKGLTGSGYDGHAFWDTEIFLLPVLTYSIPDAVRDALRWRYETLPKARQRASQLGLAGAAFPWRTIAGEECSGYWPAGTAAFHVNSAVAHATRRYLGATEDGEFERHEGLEMLVETARLWRSLGHHDPQGEFHIDGITGPDEYSAIANDNVYTNLMAKQNLQSAVAVSQRHMGKAKELGVDDEEVASWRDAAERMALPYDHERQVHEQSAGFTQQQAWNFEKTRPEEYPLLLHFPYFDLYRKQVIKQADLVLAMYLCGAAFSDDEKLRNFDYYEQFTVRDSSLSAACQAVIAAEVGHLHLAYDYLRETSFIDLEDINHNTRDGLHLAALAGTWLALVAGFGGMRQDGTTLSFRPHLPDTLSHLRFNMRFRGRQLRIDIGRRRASYLLVEGEPITLQVESEDVKLEPGTRVERSISSTPRLAPPRHPKGRAPASHGQGLGFV